MIMITNLETAKTLEADTKYAVIRSYKYPVPGIEQIKELSPSWNLFREYMKLRENRMWNRTAFEESYAPKFVTEIAHDREARRILHRFLERDKAGETVILACFCKNEALCHRLVLADILMGLGADVRLQSGKIPSKRWYGAYMRELAAAKKKKDET